MGRRGPLPQENNVRELRGNAGKRTPKPRVRAKTAIPSAPEWLGAEGRATWNRVTAELAERRTISQGDREVLCLFCDAVEVWNRARRKMKKSVLAKGQLGEDRKNPAWQIYRDSAALIVSLAKELGCTPSALLRMELPEGPGEDDDSIFDA